MNQQKEDCMPIFMDRHELPGLTATDVAEGHRQDLKIQHKFNCRALTYWYDETKNVAFCLIEAPSKEAVCRLHDSSHGLIPNRIIEVQGTIVEAFLGRITDPQTADEADMPQRIGPAFRTILLTELKNAAQFISKAGKHDSSDRLHTYNGIIRAALAQHQGREVECRGGGIMAVFPSVRNAVDCAVAILSGFKEDNQEHCDSFLQVAVGLSAGNPVTDKDQFFGEAVQFANRLCYIARPDQIVISSVVGDHYKKKPASLPSGVRLLKFFRPEEEVFLNHLLDITEKRWNKEDFNVVDFSRRMGLSRSQMYRRMMEITGFSPNDFIKEFKMRQSLILIEKHRLNIAQIAYECGFNSPSYFSKCFQERFGVLPSTYANTTEGW
jgi:AraC-like DNA-binding protein